MNVNEFAEQIVFGKTIEDKLLIPGKLTHSSNDSALPNVRSLRAPGRPIGLKMWEGDNAKVQPPSDDKLENERARGKLLHFLANHELLATELMALVLLKFPDAPHAFRRGVLVTLQEEQEHTRMYIRRMRECGVEFGSYPLNGQFWRMVEPMDSPMDFVARLSLTFEQANLDYSLHFASVFRKLGDIQTADVLQQIYEDEIGHVQHGLHWFRQWKNPEENDWEAYQKLLEFPMSPQRGLGPRGAFNREGRRRAGLTNDFIDAIEVYRQSRGRPPTVHWFDPSSESELAHELSDRDARLMKQIGLDLELAMVPMAKQDDIVLVRRVPSRACRKSMIDAGLDLPQFVLISERSALVQRKLNGFLPWAWTPKNLEIAQPLIESALHSPPTWREGSDDLFRKSWGSAQLRQWLESGIRHNELPDWFTTADCTAIPVNHVSDVIEALSNLAQRGFATAIFKLDLASSGRGQRRLDCTHPLGPGDRDWLRSKLETRTTITNSTSLPNQQPLGIVEPELDRLVDFSLLWNQPCETASPKFLGWTEPLTTGGRRYVGTRLGNPLSNCEKRIKRFMLADRCARLNSVVDWLETQLGPELSARNFTGYFGIDSMVCQDQNGDLKIKPLVELNPRMTMGHIALSLKKRLASGVAGEFRILTKSQWNLVHEELSQIPLVRTRDGRWKSGVLWLGEVDDHTTLIPVLLIGPVTLNRFKALTQPVISAARTESSA